MSSLSLNRLLAIGAALYHIALAVPQAPIAVTQPATFLPPESSAAPAVEGSGGGCGQCQLVADVAGLVWYSQVFINTAATNYVQVGVNNASRSTRTSLIQNEGEFTYNPGATAAGGGALTQVNFEPSVTVGGVILTSPTAYNVFTGFTITSAFSSDGSCVTTTQVSTLDSAYSEILSSANGRVVLDANGQQSFIDFLGFSTCSGGGENVQATALLQVTNTTATQTTTFSGIMAAQSVSLSIPSVSSPASASASATTNMTFPSAGVPEIVIGNTTITPTANPIGLPVYNGTTFAGTGTNGLQPIPTGPVTPFIAAGSVSRADGWLMAWIVGSIGIGALVVYL